MLRQYAPVAAALPALCAILLGPARATGDLWGQHAPSARDASEAAGPVRPGVSGRLDRPAPRPRVHETTWIDPAAQVIGNLELGERSLVGAGATLRADGVRAVHLGAWTNVQERAVVHAGAPPAPGDATEPAGRTPDGADWAVWIGDRVSIAPQAQVHGPAWIEDDVYVGMQALVYRARIGTGSVIEPGARVIGVQVPAGRYVAAGAVITTPAAAQALPEITFSYGLRELNKQTVRAHVALAESLQGRPPPAAPE